jgi:KaiC/GvpD/RAD55 family RecA-like ATPase
MIHSGIAPLDQQLGGVFPGRLHLLTGGPGTGKSTACLQFLNAGLRNGEAVALLTLDRLADLSSHARCTGLDLGPSLLTGRLALLRFRPEFASLLARAGLPDRVIDDFRRLIAGVQPARLVIDPLTPFLADGSASGAALAALGHLLDALGVTALITYPGDVSAGYDARLDPIVQRAAAIVHFVRDDGGTNRMQIVQTRPCATPANPVRFALRPGAGLVTLAGENQPAELNGVAARIVRPS